METLRGCIAIFSVVWIILWQLISHDLPRHIAKFVWKFGTTLQRSQLCGELGNQLRTLRCSRQLWCDWTSQVCSTVTSFPSCFNHWARQRSAYSWDHSYCKHLNIYSTSFSWAFSVKRYIKSYLLELLSTLCISYTNGVSIHDLSILSRSIIWFFINCFCISVVYILGVCCLQKSVLGASCI